MGKAGKVTLGVVGAVVAIIIIAVAVIWMHLGGIVKDAVQTYGSQATGTSVTLDKADIVVTSGQGEFDGLQIGNPQGFTSGYALRFNKIKLRLDTGSLTGNPIVVNAVTVDGASLNADFKGTQSNLKQILDNLKSYAGPSQAEEQPPGAAKKFIIKKFLFTNAEMTVRSDLANVKRTVDIPNVSLSNIGAQSGGATGAEIARQVLRPVIEKALEKARTGVLQNGMERLKKKAGKTLQEKLRQLGQPSSG